MLMREAIHKMSDSVSFHLNEKSRIGKSIKIGSRLVVVEVGVGRNKE